jgi:hypothetical protein
MPKKKKTIDKNFNRGSGFFSQMNDKKSEEMQKKRKRSSAKRRLNKGVTWTNARKVEE